MLIINFFLCFLIDYIDNQENDDFGTPERGHNALHSDTEEIRSESKKNEEDMDSNLDFDMNPDAHQDMDQDNTNFNQNEVNESESFAFDDQEEDSEVERGDYFSNKPTPTLGSDIEAEYILKTPSKNKGKQPELAPEDPVEKG